VKTRTPLALALSLVLLQPAISRSDELSVDVPRTAAVAGAAAAAFGVLELTGNSLTPGSCRWCEPPAVDRNTRLHLRWSDTKLAGNISDVLLVAIPVSLATMHYLALTQRDLGRFGEDALVTLEALALTAVATDAVKYAVARRRPDAWASGVRTSAGDDNAFLSGHASGTFAAAASFGTVAMLRGYPGWPWLSAAGFTSATAISYLRMAADRHWLTDVVAGAALGTGIGIAVPLLLHRKAREPDGRSATIIVTPVPLGVAGTF
jgi:membrane-associated phospholipid phosphatase